MTAFTITKVYPSRIGGVGLDEAYTPMVGEPYRLTVEFDVDGSPQAPYPVCFHMANRFGEVQVTDLTPGHKHRSMQFSLPLDGDIPWQVDIDPYHYADGVDPVKSPMPHTFPDIVGDGGQGVPVRRPARAISKATKKGVFQPAPPPTSIDYYDPVTALLWHHFAATFNPGGKLDRMVVMMGLPTSESWQQVNSAGCTVQSGAGSWSVLARPVENPSQYPVYYWDRNDLPVSPVTMVEQCVLELCNVRVDLNKLRGVTWKALDDSRTSQPYNFYGQPEAVIESDDPNIASFVQDALGPGYRQKMSPYDAARKLFQTVLARTSYYYPQPGQPDLRPTTAAGMAKKGFGDCGGFSILLVALFRKIGFPARTACGAWVGLDAGHCWCELYFPGHGWVLCDGSAGNAWSEAGEYAYYFGNIPDSNNRFANMRGNTFNVGDVEASWLQGPWQKTWGSATEKATSVHTMLLKGLVIKPSEAEKLPLDVAIQRPSIEIRPELAFRSCPCSRHGGFMPRAGRRSRGKAPGVSS
jgi:transglutaminase-like putative cysteine protease